MRRLALILLSICAIALGADDKPNYPRPIMTVRVVAASDSDIRVMASADYLCDGTDDDAEIQDAIDALTSGGKVFLARGNYSIGSTITIDDGVWLQGEGNQTILTLAADVNDSILQNTTRTGAGDSNIRVSDMRFDGNKANNTGTTTLGAVVDFDHVTNLVIENIEVVDADQQGIGLSTCNTAVIRGCYLATADRDAIRAVLSSYDILIEGNTIYHCGRVSTAINDGIKIQDGSYNVTVNDNVITNCARGIEITSHPTASGGLADYNITVSGNTLNGNTTGILIADSQGGDNAAYNVSIVGNSILDANDEASHLCISVDCLKNSVISGNTISHYSSDALKFIEGITDVVISNNAIVCADADSTNALTGVRFGSTVDANRVTIANNIIDGYGYIGLHFDGGTARDVLVYANTITNCDNAAGRAITFDSATYANCVLSGNRLEGANHTVYDTAATTYEQIPAGWSSTGGEPWNRRLLTAATYSIEDDERGKVYDVNCAANDVVVTLPAATVGMEFTFVVTEVTNELRLDPDGSEYINLVNGTATGSAGDYITNDTAKAVGDTLRVKCLIAGIWQPFDAIGTWTEE